MEPSHRALTLSLGSNLDPPPTSITTSSPGDQTPEPTGKANRTEEKAERLGMAFAKAETRRKM